MSTDIFTHTNTIPILNCKLQLRALPVKGLRKKLFEMFAYLRRSRVYVFVVRGDCEMTVVIRAGTSVEY